MSLYALTAEGRFSSGSPCGEGGKVRQDQGGLLLGDLGVQVGQGDHRCGDAAPRPPTSSSPVLSSSAP